MANNAILNALNTGSFGEFKDAKAYPGSQILFLPSESTKEKDEYNNTIYKVVEDPKHPRLGRQYQMIKKLHEYLQKNPNATFTTKEDGIMVTYEYEAAFTRKDNKMMIKRTAPLPDFDIEEFQKLEETVEAETEEQPF